MKATDLFDGYELTKTKADVGTYQFATETGWENRPAKPREDLLRNGMRWRGKGSSCKNPQVVWI